MKFNTRACVMSLVKSGVAASLLVAGCKPVASRPPPASSGPQAISLAPSITEIVYALGGSNQLIGRTSCCDYPPEAVSQVPVIGEFGVPSLERMVARHPDLVLFTDIADPLMESKMKRVGLHPVRIACERLTDIPGAILKVGGLIQREVEAQTLATNLILNIEQAKVEAGAFKTRPRVLALIWHDPFYAAGQNSFVSDLIALAGGVNVGDEIKRDYFQTSSEWVVAHDPDIVLCFFMASKSSVAQSIKQQPGWRHIKAVRDGRVYDGFDNNVALRPGPRVMQGLEIIKNTIHAN